MAKKETNLTLGISEPQKVNEYMDSLKHPLLDLAQYLRTYILGIDKNIGEGIYWNVPTFFFTGKMKPFDSKEYKRFIVNFNFYKQDTLRIIFLRGADATDPTGLLEGDYKDGRRVSSFKSIEELKKKEKELKIIIKQLLALMDK
ncbi:MAG TPA: hypothetical protein DCQ26_10880 [Marinilabiliales bacterium]|nr:MAG: hypothetical protein A2W84_14115 [Bacteroidetes bacterium GWC2_40_13]OFX74668.1 MAG: hypothetical protein A2W96_04340 [Bacteroidetes bacterium GWD2_40_43]OFX93744.1 MAG: hypothetical protein A2W97_16110 [Bacteroidetes bacterium GWE2_40_63]OFZ28014.1 MAG: hypothetical protein A2437_01160 [Bacteroidetes bacterium RIFOXYC2_FULL_40_12]HAB51461.1 hypothetical protein [Ignavibacteriales bacterium]HAM99100.1 hypothetical protein [Marinilabiliales bacterium]